MKLKLLLTSILLLAFLSAQAKDMQAYLNETEEMARQGEHKEALERFIWFHNHALEHEPSMYGVRLSFALNSWKQLGKVYPPALEAMKEIRDEKTELLKSEKGNDALFHDVFALNRTLEENEKTVELFEQIDQEQPEKARKYWNVAKEAVLEAKRYDLARKYIGSPGREFARVKAAYDRNVALYDDPRLGGEHFVSYNEKNLVDESLRLIDLALAFDDKKAARDIQEKALALVDDYRLRDAVEDEGGESEETPAEGR